MDSRAQFIGYRIIRLRSLETLSRYANFCSNCVLTQPHPATGNLSLHFIRQIATMVICFDITRSPIDVTMTTFFRHISPRK